MQLIRGLTKKASCVNRIAYITPSFAVTGALQPADFPEAAARGFKSILSNLPDGESSAYPTAAQEAVLAADAGLGFRHVPVVKSEAFSDAVVEGVAGALDQLEGPVLAHCASGLRSAIVWAAAAARSQPADCVLARLRDAGFDLSPVREELDAQRGRPAPDPTPEALDCRCDGGADD
jgi:sulfide:quinone oxidoreductase